MKIRDALARFRGQREFHVDIIGRRRRWFVLSGVFLFISVLGLGIRQLNLGIDFQGGALLEFENASGASVDEVRERLMTIGREEAIIQEVSGNRLSVRTESLGEDRTQILAAIAELAAIQPADVSVQDVGPKWGAQISQKMLQGLFIFLAVVIVYLSFRFEWKMAVAAIVALFHDLIITFGIYALVGREVTPEAVIAILTILGYSLYDTVVIFDKMKENTESLALVSKETYGGTVNISLNQVLMRSVNTSLASLLPIGALLLFGGDTLKNFAFALLVGVAIGAYSSIFVAAPLVVVLKEREPKLREIAARAERRAVRTELRPAPSPATAGAESSPSSASVVGTLDRGALLPAPRPRKQRRRQPRSKRRRR
ncbi:MAG: protein translocase subunit SecF [Actinomycetota bacterium]